MKNFVAQGDSIPVVESALVHPVQTDGLVNGGDQVVAGTLTGVAEFDAAATTDVITIVRKGIVTVPVIGSNAGGNSAVAVGDKLFIDAGAAAAISKNATKQPFGIALAAVGAGATATIEVLLTGF